VSREDRDAIITARNVTQALIAVINDTPTGASADLLYAPLQQYLTRERFEQTMRLLVAAERVTQRGERYYPLRTVAAPTGGNVNHPKFRDHFCARCRDGERPCVRGNPTTCEWPHARND
jgi:hypothetical protein